MVVDVTTTSLAHMEAGKLRAIAIAGNARHSKLPGVPTVVEAGLPGLQYPFWPASWLLPEPRPKLLRSSMKAFDKRLQLQTCAPALMRSARKARLVHPESSRRCLQRNLQSGQQSQRPQTSRSIDC